jgi:hypothetical protein
MADGDFFAVVAPASGVAQAAEAACRHRQLGRALYAERLEPFYQHGTIITRAAWEQHGSFDETFRFCGDYV